MDRQHPNGDEAIEWQVIAKLLGEFSETPVLVIDEELRIHLWNSALEQVLGWTRQEMLGRCLLETGAAEDNADRACIEEAFQGIKRACESPMVARDGRRLRMQWDLFLAGHRRRYALVARLRAFEEEVREEAPLEAPRFPGDRHYLISTEGERFGTIIELWSKEHEGPPPLGERCYQALSGQEAPCPGCPAIGLPPGARRTTIVSRPPPAHDYTIVTAEGVTPTTVRLNARVVSEPLLRELLSAKVQALARRAQLSAREQEVLHQLVAGRTVQDIAEALAIAHRTVKYHQANILAKLGADSRVDLLRLIF